MSVYIITGTDGRPAHIAFWESSALKWFDKYHTDCADTHHLERYEPSRKGTEYVSRFCLDHDSGEEISSDVHESDPLLNTEAVLGIARAHLLGDAQTVEFSLASMTYGDFMQGALSAIATMASGNTDDYEPTALAAELLRAQNVVIARYAEAHPAEETS